MLALPVLPASGEIDRGLSGDREGRLGERALARVKALTGNGALGSVGDATSVFREVASSMTELPFEDRKGAARLFLRPTDGSSTFAYAGQAGERTECIPNLCFHWVETSSDAPDPVDADANTIPDFVDEMIEVFVYSWDVEVTQFGFLAPLSDAGASNGGPDERLDVYVENTAQVGSPGYVMPSRFFARSGPTSTFVVMDNDFDEYLPLFGPRSLLLKSVVSHEFFHAVQGAYDFFDDLWLLEGSAAWMEEEVYDETNYIERIRLQASAMTDPGRPLDLGAGGFQYGSVLFWRFLSEQLGSTGARDHDLMRRIWELAANPRGPNDPFSLGAVRTALSERGVNLRSEFASFAVANHAPEVFYDEGAGYLAAVGRPPATTTVFSRSHLRSKKSVRLSHLSNLYLIHRPGNGISDSARMRVSFDLPAERRGSQASVVVFEGTGDPQVERVGLSRRGNGSVRVSFGGDVKKVVVVVGNASSRYRDCGSRHPFSCGGSSKDDELLYEVKSVVVQ